MTGCLSTRSPKAFGTTFFLSRTMHQSICAATAYFVGLNLCIMHCIYHIIREMLSFVTNVTHTNGLSHVQYKAPGLSLVSTAVPATTSLLELASLGSHVWLCVRVWLACNTHIVHKGSECGYHLHRMLNDKR